MSEEKKDTAATGQADNDKRSFGLQRIYLKDVSFESPRSPDVFRSEWRPAVSINIGMQSRPLGDDTHEVVLTLNVEAKQEDKVAMLIEVQQAGIRSEEHTSELQSRENLVCRLLLEKKK